MTEGGINATWTSFSCWAGNMLVPVLSGGGDL